MGHAAALAMSTPTLPQPNMITHGHQISGLSTGQASPSQHHIAVLLTNQSVPQTMYKCTMPTHPP